MATRWAVATGNWSNPAIWNGGTLPTSSDDVFADGKTVTIDQNIQVLTLRRSQRGGGTVGGTFLLNGNYEVRADIWLYGESTTSTLTYSGTGVASIVGNIVGTTEGTGGAIALGVIHSGSGTLNVTGTVGTGSVGNWLNGRLISFSGTGRLNIVGNVITQFSGGNNGCIGIAVSGSNSVLTIVGNVNGHYGGNVNQTGISITSSSQTTITGNVLPFIGTWGGNATNAITLASNGAILTVNGNVTGGGTSVGNTTIAATAASSLRIIGSLTASSALAASIGGVTSTVLSGPFISSPSGLLPFTATSAIRIEPILNNYFSFRDASLNEKQLYSGDTLGSPPLASDVRFGTKYAYNSLTGTLRMPTAQQVAFGVPVDATTGTAYFTVADFWNYLLSNGFTAGSIGDRLKNVATVDTTGSQLAAGN